MNWFRKWWVSKQNITEIQRWTDFAKIIVFCCVQGKISTGQERSRYVHLGVSVSFWSFIVSKSAFSAGGNYLTTSACSIFSVNQWPNSTTGFQSKSLKPLDDYLIALYLHYWFRTQLNNLINIHNYQQLIFMWLCRCHLHILYLYI